MDGNAAEVRLPRRLLDDIGAAAEAAWPEECCGLVVGRDEPDGPMSVTRLTPSRNLAAEPRRNFEIAPQLWLDLRRELAAGPERILGLYHSHPEGDANPSARDLDAAWPLAPDAAGIVWLIAALHEGRVTDTRACIFDATNIRFRPARLAAVD